MLTHNYLTSKGTALARLRPSAPFSLRLGLCSRAILLSCPSLIGAGKAETACIPALIRRGVSECRSCYVLYRLVCGWVRDDRPLIRTRNDLLELIAHALRLQLSYLSKDQALAVADTILRTFKAARLSIRRRR
jgi:hypothetical protein